MIVDVVTRWQGLDDLRGAWPPCGDAAPPTLDPRWFVAAAQTLYEPDSLHVVVVHHGGEVAAVAPLGRAVGRAGPRLEVLGSRDLHEPGGLPHRDEPALRALVDAVLATGRPVHLGRLRAGGAEARLLSSLPRWRVLVARRGTPGTPVVDLRGRWEDFDATLPADRRSSLRRNARRADESGGFHFDVVVPSSDAVDALLGQFVAVEDRSWKGQAGTSLHADTRLRRFYLAYARSAAAAGELRVSRLWVGDHLAAVQLAVEHAQRLWVLKLGYDDAWSRCAPGIVLTHETLRWAFDRGLAGYELLGDAAPWTRIWTNAVHPYEVVRAYPAVPSALPVLAGDALGYARRRRGARERA